MPASNAKVPPPALIDKIAALPSDRIAEVEDFVDFLSQRESAHALRRSAAAASAPAFEKVWRNRDDDIYDAL